MKKPIVQYDLNMKEIDKFESILLASEKLNISKSSILDNLNGKTKKCHKKFIFEYL